MQRLLTAVLWLVVFVEVAGVAYLRGATVHADTHQFIEHAHNLAAHGRFAITDASGALLPEPVFPLGYPIFLLVTVVLLGLGPSAVIFVQLALLGGALALLQRALQAHGVPSWVFALAMVLYPFPFLYYTVMGVEALATAAMTASVALLLLSEDGRWLGFVGAGALFGFAVLVRPPLAVTGLGLVGVAWLVATGAPRLRAQRVLLACAAAAVILAPFTLRNLVVFGRAWPLPPVSPAPISLFNKMVGEKYGYDAIIDFSFNKPPRVLVDSGFMDTIREINEEVGAPPDASPFTAKTYIRHGVIVEAAATVGRHAWVWVDQAPGEYAAAVGRDFFRLWLTIKAFARKLPGPFAAALVAAQIGYLIVALFGVGLTLRRRQWTLAAVALFPLMLTALHSLLHVEARYTAAVRWSAWLFFAVAVAALIEAGARRRARYLAGRPGH